MDDEAIEGRLRQHRLVRPSAAVRARILASAERREPSEWHRLWTTLQASAAALMFVWTAAALSEHAVEGQLARLSDRTNPAMVAERRAETREQLAQLLNGASNEAQGEYLARQLCLAQPRRLVRPPGDDVAFGTCAGGADLMSESGKGPKPPREPTRDRRNEATSRVGTAPPIPRLRG